MNVEIGDVVNTIMAKDRYYQYIPRVTRFRKETGIVTSLDNERRILNILINGKNYKFHPEIIDHSDNIRIMKCDDSDELDILYLYLNLSEEEFNKELRFKQKYF